MLEVWSDQAQGVWPYLAEAARHSSLQEVELVCSEPVHGKLSLVPSTGLASLPHLRHLALFSSAGCLVQLLLPAPLLESLRVWGGLDREFNVVMPLLTCVGGPAPGVSFEDWLVLGAGAGHPSAAAPFPALKRLEVGTMGCLLDGSSVPGLEELELELHHPNAYLVCFHTVALSRLTCLCLGASGDMAPATLGEGGEGGGEFVPSNCFAPLLAATTRALRRLDITICESPGEALAAALAGLVQLTYLSLSLPCIPRSAQQGGAPAAAQGLAVAGEAQPVGAPHTVSFDCQLLTGLKRLERLRVSGGTDGACMRAIQRASALQGLATLQLSDRAGMLPLARHLPPSCTRLDMLFTSPEDLEEEQLDILSGLPHLRHLALCTVNRERFAAGAAPGPAQARHAAAMQALVERLPAGCVVEAIGPDDWMHLVRD